MIFIVTYDTPNGGYGVLGEWYPSTLDAAKAICQHIREGDHPKSIRGARCYTDELGGVYRIEELNGPKEDSERVKTSSQRYYKPLSASKRIAPRCTLTVRCR